MGFMLFIKRSTITQFFFIAVLYFMLATGKVLPIYAGTFIVPIITIIITAVFFYVSTEKLSFKAFSLMAFLALFLVAYLASAFRSENPQYLLEKIEGGFLTTLFMIPIISYFIDWYGVTRFCERFLQFGMLILVLTIIYKLQFGFWDRSVRFFINGPIVFGWIMGMLSIVSGYLAIQGIKPTRHQIFMAIFLFAVFWTLSRGPLLALLPVLLLMHLRSIEKRAARKSIAIFAAGAVGVFLYVPSEFFGRIFYFLERLTTIGVEAELSDNLRVLMWREAITLWEGNFLFGIGPANYALVTSYSPAKYPHNLTLELLAEIGLLGAMIPLAFLVYLALTTTSAGRYMLLFLVGCTMMSGDLSYFRFFLFFPVAFALANFAPLSSIKKVRTEL